MCNVLSVQGAHTQGFLIEMQLWTCVRHQQGAKVATYLLCSICTTTNLDDPG